MTIYRIGPDPDAVPQYRVGLGRILVTMDDIESLMIHLGRHEKDSDSPVVVEFNAGYFTEARDLSKINPLEMEFLRLKSSRMLVILGTYSAVAIGDIQEAEGVYNSWAMSLETKELPPRVRKDKITTVVFAGILLILGAFSYGASILFQRFYYQVGQLYFGIASVFSFIGFLTFALILYILYNWDKKFKQSTYAIVVPYSRDEYRRNELSQKYPRRSWIVAIVAVIIAAISIAANVWLVLTR